MSSQSKSKPERLAKNNLFRVLWKGLVASLEARDQMLKEHGHAVTHDASWKEMSRKTWAHDLEVSCLKHQVWSDMTTDEVAEVERVLGKEGTWFQSERFRTVDPTTLSLDEVDFHNWKNTQSQMQMGLFPNISYEQWRPWAHARILEISRYSPSMRPDNSLMDLLMRCKYDPPVN